MIPAVPDSFTSEFAAVPPPSHDLADLLPELLAESQTFLSAYMAGLLTAAEYVLLDLLGGAAATDGRAAPVPLALVRRCPDADATVESLLRMGLACVTAETVQLAPLAVQIVADSVTEALQ